MLGARRSARTLTSCPRSASGSGVDPNSSTTSSANARPGQRGAEVKLARRLQEPVHAQSSARGAVRYLTVRGIVVRNGGQELMARAAECLEVLEALMSNALIGDVVCFLVGP